MSNRDNKSNTAKENNKPDNKAHKDDKKEKKKKADKEDKKDKKYEYVEAELQRLQDSMRKEAEKIHKPERQKFKPYTFNGLDPYFDISTAKFVHEMPMKTPRGYASRSLATGLCEPQVALRMDVDIPERTQSQTSPSPETERHENRKKKKDDKSRPPAEGSTRLPQYPAVKFSPSKLPPKKNKNYDFNDVPTLRQVINEQCSPRGSKRVEEDYEKTKADFYRMELDKMDEYSSINRPNMKEAYFAYLQNTIGSSKAVLECVQSAEEQQNDDNQSDEEKDEDEESRETEDRNSCSEKYTKKSDGRSKDEKDDKGRKKNDEKKAKSNSDERDADDKEKRRRDEEDKKREKAPKKEEKRDSNAGKRENQTGAGKNDNEKRTTESTDRKDEKVRKRR